MLALASDRGLPEAEWNILSVMAIAFGPLRRMTAMAPPVGVANAEIVSLFITIFYLYSFQDLCNQSVDVAFIVGFHLLGHSVGDNHTAGHSLMAH